jgi:hypothetical protein
MIQEDRTVPCEINISITLGIRIVSSVEGIRQCTCYNKEKKKTDCNCQLCTNPGYQVAMATKFCTMAPNLSTSSIRHYLGFQCGASEICILLGSYTTGIGNSIPIFRDNLSVPS